VRHECRYPQGMRPSICALCGKRFGLEEGGIVDFSMIDSDRNGRRAGLRPR
jgi:hypothetical protein